MKVVFYTSGAAGSGRLVRGIAVGNALKRSGFNGEFTILSSSGFAHLADLFGIEHLEIPLENEFELSKENYKNSLLYATLQALEPDVLVIDLLWFSLYYFIHELPCKKIFICHQVVPDFFAIRQPGVSMTFLPEQYDKLIAIEPFDSEFGFERINPVIIRNRDELFPPEAAREKLGLPGNAKTALIAVNARPGDYEQIRQKYDYLRNEGYTLLYSSNYKGGLFPIVDYYNAVDLVVCLAGYNQFWECRFFNKNAIYETIPLRFSSMSKRIEECGEVTFTQNGADRLAELVLNG